MTENANKAPTWFRVVAIVALIWNAFGLFVFLSQMFITEEALAAMEEADRQMMLTRPIWATAGFGLGVIAGTLGSVLLVMKKKSAAPVLLLSLLGIVVQQIHGFFMSNYVEMVGVAAIIFPLLVLLIAIMLWMMARSATAKGWLS